MRKAYHNFTVVVLVNFPKADIANQKEDIYFSCALSAVQLCRRTLGYRYQSGRMPIVRQAGSAVSGPGQDAPGAHRGPGGF